MVLFLGNRPGWDRDGPKSDRDDPGRSLRGKATGMEPTQSLEAGPEGEI